MGYQESIVTCEDFEYLEGLFRECGEDFFDERWVEIAGIGTLREDIRFKRSQKKYKEMKKGQKFFWIAGDRAFQRYIGRSRDGLFGVKVDESKNVDLVFIETCAKYLFTRLKNKPCFNYEKFEFKGAKKMSEDLIKVVVIEPMEQPVLKEVKNELKTFQNIVGGLIEHVGFEFKGKNIDLICNEEGKLLELPYNRSIYSDYVAGTFFITASDKEGNFISLEQEQIHEIMLMFDLDSKEFKAML